jgi:hypothetical protein
MAHDIAYPFHLLFLSSSTWLGVSYPGPTGTLVMSVSCLTHPSRSRKREDCVLQMNDDECGRS